MNQTLKKLAGIFSLSAAVFCGTNAYPAIVTLNSAQAGGSWWDTASYWSNNSAPTAGNDYEISFILRSQENENAADSQNNVFKGDSLTILPGGNLYMKSSVTVGNLILDGGTIRNAKRENATVTFAGNVSVRSTGNVESYETDPKDGRSLRMTAKISGDADSAIAFQTAAVGKIWILNPNNDFQGTMTLRNNTNVYLYENAGAQNAGTLGTSAVKLVTGSNAHLYTNESLELGSWTAKYFSDNQERTVLMPSSITVSDAYTQDALRIAGIDAPINSTLTFADSTRAPAVYYTRGTNVPESTGLDTANIWAVGSASGTVSSNLPTVGDEAHIAHSIRTSSSSDHDVAGKNHYFLAKTYLDTGGLINLKNSQATLYFPDLILNGGTLGNGRAEGTVSDGLPTNRIDGHITVQAESSVRAKFCRSVVLLADISDSASGTANIRITQDVSETGGKYQKTTNTTLVLSGDNSAYSGKFDLEQYTTMKTAADNSLGTGGFIMNGNSTVTVGGAQSVNSVTIQNSDNVVDVTGSLTAAAASISGTNTRFTGNAPVFGTLNLEVGSSYTTDAYHSTVTFENGFTADTVNMKSVLLKVTGGDVVIGKEDLSTNFWIPIVQGDYSEVGTYKVGMDLSGADSALIQANHFGIANSTSLPNAKPTVDVHLAKNTKIKANTMSVASSNNTDLNPSKSENVLYLGSVSTDIAVDDIYVGGGYYLRENGEMSVGAKAKGGIYAVEGGKVTINGTDGTSPANLYIGWANANTGQPTIGTVDLSGVSAESVLNLNQFVVGKKAIDTANTTATFTMNAGTVNADTLTIAHVDGISGNGNPAGSVTGTVNLNGGTLNVKNVQQGSAVGRETAVFNFNDGTLKVSNWGTSEIPLNLTQKGGTLSPQSELLKIYGNYKQESGRILLDLGMQKVLFNGDAEVKTLMVAWNSTEAFDDEMLYEVFTVEDGILDVSLMELVVDTALEEYDLIYHQAGNSVYVGTAGQIASQLPEPASWVILVLGAVGLGLGRRFSRKAKN